MSYFKPIGDAKVSTRLDQVVFNGKWQILEKKPPKSVVYDDVKTTLNTGLVRKKKEGEYKLTVLVQHFRNKQCETIQKAGTFQKNERIRTNETCLIENEQQYPS